jgi:hypothetical protein
LKKIPTFVSLSGPWRAKRISRIRARKSTTNRLRAMHYSRSADAVIRVYDEAGNVIETHEHKGDFKEC